MSNEIMRDLFANEIGYVSGGDGCPAPSSTTTVGTSGASTTSTNGTGPGLIEFYEGVVQAVSHIIERVVEATK